jgi:hypothetical protein
MEILGNTEFYKYPLTLTHININSYSLYWEIVNFFFLCDVEFTLVYCVLTTFILQWQETK